MNYDPKEVVLDYGIYQGMIKEIASLTETIKMVNNGTHVILRRGIGEKTMWVAIKKEDFYKEQNKFTVHE